LRIRIDRRAFVPLGLEEVLKEEVEKEVTRLDRESIEKRDEYFRGKLKLHWEKDNENYITEIDKINRLQNRIVHENIEERVDVETMTSLEYRRKKSIQAT
jgi:hypothetical protein